MIGDTIVQVYARSGETVNASHIAVPAYASAVPLAANVQPKALSEAKAKELGLSTAASGAQLLVAVDPAALITEGAKVVANGVTYDVAGVARYAGHHVEAILVPKQGGQS